MDDVSTAQAWRVTVRRRVVVAGVLFLLWGLAIEARLVFLQVFQRDALIARATAQRNKTINIPARRGGIVDRNGRTLAMSVGAGSVVAEPAVIASPETTITALCGVLDGCGTRERDALIERVKQNGKAWFLYVRRQVTPQETRRVLALKLTGIRIVEESQRLYPNRELAAHVLGWVGVDNKGLGGIEAAYDTRIRGRDGSLLLELDSSKERRPYARFEQPPTAGATIELTIDTYLQHVAERELHAAVQEHDAVGGTVVVMDPRTGEILALANEPTFNPNAFGDATDDARRNRASQEIYEPGSTFKVVTASAAIEEHAFTMNEPIDVSAGMIKLPGRVVDDVRRYGVLSFTDVIVKSSNVGAIKVGTRLGNERLNRYVRRFGFGKRLCPDLRGESAGMLADPASWSLNTLASISMGYEIGVTPLQMATAVSSVANGGSLIQPRVVRAQRAGTRRTVVEPLDLGRTIDAATIAEMTTIMEQVVERGTGGQARVPGFTVAGKTGTAAKNANGRYSRTDYHASFVGFIPSRRPVLTILVVIDTPRGPGYPTHHKYYGGDIAAPVFQRVADQSLRYLGVAPTTDPAPPVLMIDLPVAWPAGTVTPAAATGSEPTMDVQTGAPTVPELRGLGAREAIRRLSRLGLTAHVSGDGVVTAQEPEAGTPVGDRSTCSLKLGRAPVPPPASPQ